MPHLIRLYIVNVAIGFAISAVFMALVLTLDLVNLRHLLLETPSGWIAGLMLFFFNGTVFAGVQFAIAVMNLAEDDSRTPRGGLRLPLHLTPIKATARPR